MDNSQHYDSITEAWQFMLGEHFHWGYFKNDQEDLQSATVNLIDLMLSQLKLDQIKSVIDIGCGIGNTSIYLREKLNCEVTGISNSPIGIKKAQENIKKKNYEDKINFQLRDATNNQLADGIFDVCWLLEMSHLIDDKQLLINESSRILKSGGEIILCDLMFNRKLKASEIFNNKEDLIKLESSFGKARIEEMSAYQKYFENANLLDIEITNISEQVKPTTEFWKENVMKNYDLISASLPKHSIDNFLISCDLLSKYYSEGAWGYGIIKGRKK
jgi:tocopherol O-methyltransferase